MQTRSRDCEAKWADYRADDGPKVTMGMCQEHPSVERIIGDVLDVKLYGWLMSCLSLDLGKEMEKSFRPRNGELKYSLRAFNILHSVEGLADCLCINVVLLSVSLSSSMAVQTFSEMAQYLWRAHDDIYITMVRLAGCLNRRVCFNEELLQDEVDIIANPNVDFWWHTRGVERSVECRSTHIERKR